MKKTIIPLDSGAASMIFLFTLFFISALILGAAAYISSAIIIQGREKDVTITMGEMDNLLDDVIAAIKSDPDPEVNGIDDPVWAWNGKNVPGYTVSLVPISDRINLNFVRKNVFDKTRLSLLFRPGKNADELQQFREDSGLFFREGAFRDFFEEGILKKYFSSYGWANINLTDEFAARQLGTILTDDPIKGEALREKIRILLINRRFMDRENLPVFLGTSFEELFPFINAEPLMNINFVDPLILKELIAYPDYRIRHPQEISLEIVSRRKTESLSTEDMCTILGTDKSNPLFYYLGCITWFWEINILAAEKDHSQRAVLCRLPIETYSTETRPEYKIIERRFK